MRIIVRAAIAVASLGTIGSAYADGGDGVVANTQFTQIPGVVADAPVQNVPSVVVGQDGQAIHGYVTQSDHRTWISPPIQNYLDQ
jgi:hypothetical protein